MTDPNRLLTQFLTSNRKTQNGVFLHVKRCHPTNELQLGGGWGAGLQQAPVPVLTFMHVPKVRTPSRMPRPAYGASCTTSCLLLGGERPTATA